MAIDENSFLTDNLHSLTCYHLALLMPFSLHFSFRSAIIRTIILHADFSERDLELIACSMGLVAKPATIIIFLDKKDGSILDCCIRVAKSIGNHAIELMAERNTRH